MSQKQEIKAGIVKGSEVVLDNNQYLKGRNAANNGDIDLVKVNAQDEITMKNGTSEFFLSGPQNYAGLFAEDLMELYCDEFNIAGYNGISPIFKFLAGTSGDISLTVPDTTTTYTLTLPNSPGTSGYLLSTDGTGITSWIAPGGAGANTTLSNLGTTAINADLLFANGSKNIGDATNNAATINVNQISSNSNLGLYSTNEIQFVCDDESVSLYSAAGAQAPKLKFWDKDGSFSASLRAPNVMTADYTLVLPPDDGTTGQVLSTDGLGVTSWVTRANDTLSNLSASTAINEDLKFPLGSTKSVRLAKDVYLTGRNSTNTGDIDLIKVDAFNRTTLSSGVGQVIITERTIYPSANNSLSLGTATVAFAEVHSKNFVLSNGGEYARVSDTTTTPSGVANTVGFRTTAGSAASLFSSSGTTSANTFVETGNASAGNSGNINLQTGTATGTRGSIVLNAKELNLQDAPFQNNVFLQAIDGAGTGTVNVLKVSNTNNVVFGEYAVSTVNIQADDAINDVTGQFTINASNFYVNAAIDFFENPVIGLASISGNTASRPTPSVVGYQYFDTDLLPTGLPIWWDGTQWINAIGTPV